MNNEPLMRIIDSIHRSALDEKLWPTTLLEISDLLQGTTAALLHHQINGDLHGNVAAAARLWPEAAALYNQHYASLDPWAIALSRQGRLDRDFIVTSEQLVPFDELRRTEYYADFARHYDLVRNVGVGVATVPGLATTLSVLRPEFAAPFGEEERRLVAVLQPHLRTAFATHRQLIAAESRAHYLEATLERLSAAVLVLDAGGRVVFANAAARDLNKTGNRFNFDRHGVRGANPRDTTRIRQLVFQTLAIREHASFQGGDVVQLETSFSAPGLIVWAVPLLGGDSTPAESSRAAIVLFVSDPAQFTGPSAKSLQQIFALTPAEARLAVELIRGKTLSEAARRLGVTRHSARWTVKQIFRKTETASQSQLVARLLTTWSGPFLR